MAIFTAWRTATLVRMKRVPQLPRLLARRKRRTAAEHAAVRADVAAAEAQFALIEAAAREKGAVGAR